MGFVGEGIGRTVWIYCHPPLRKEAGSAFRVHSRPGQVLRKSQSARTLGKHKPAVDEHKAALDTSVSCYSNEFSVRHGEVGVHE